MTRADFCSAMRRTKPAATSAGIACEDPGGFLGLHGLVDLDQACDLGFGFAVDAGKGGFQGAAFSLHRLHLLARPGFDHLEHPGPSGQIR